MHVLLTSVFFSFGVVIASFVGVVAARLNTSQSILTGRSRCDACGEPLTPGALIPVFAYVLSRGRARCCGARLSLVSPLSELLLGGLFALSYLQLGLTYALPILLVALALLLALVLYDLAHQILPPVLLGAFVFTTMVFSLLTSPNLNALGYTALTALAIGGSLALIHFASRGRAMGLADAPLAFGLALLAGTPALAFSGFVYSFWVGAIVGITLLVRRPPGSRMGVEVPFAPFLAAGFLLALFTQWNLLILLAGSL